MEEEKIKVLSGEEIVQQVNKSPENIYSSLPKHDMKRYAPEGTPSEQIALQTDLDKTFEVVSEERVERLSSLSKGEWNNVLGKVELSTAKGKFWQHMGHNVGTKHYLNPEEALYLLECSELDLRYNDVPVSIQEAYTFMLQKSLYLEKYQVFAYLARLGYIVVRHQGRLDIGRGSNRCNRERNGTAAEIAKSEPESSSATAAQSHEDEKAKNEETADDEIEIILERSSVFEIPNAFGKRVLNLEPPPPHLLPENVMVTPEMCTLDLTRLRAPENTWKTWKRRKAGWDTRGQKRGRFWGGPGSPNGRGGPPPYFEQPFYRGPYHRGLPEPHFYRGFEGPFRSQYRPRYNAPRFENPDFVPVDDRTFNRCARDSNPGRRAEESEPPKAGLPVIATSRVKTSARSWKEFKKELQDRNSTKVLQESRGRTLWRGRVKPLVQPRDASSTANILNKLSVIPSMNVSKLENNKLPNDADSPEVSFDVYMSNSGFKKTRPGLPNFRVVVLRSCDPVPQLVHVAKMLSGLGGDGIPLRYGVVDNGVISFYTMSDVSIPYDVSVG